MPMVDVVIPVYDCDEFLSEAVESVLRQDHPDVHFFVVDDGSSRPIKGVDLRIPHAGPSAARNAGAALCSCPFLAFLDADDVWLPEKLSLSLRAIGDRENCICTSGIMWNRHRPILGEVVTTDGLLQRDHVLTSPVMTRKAFDLVGGYDSSLLLAEDLDFMFRALRSGVEFVHVPAPLVLYRKHGVALTVKHRAEHQSAVQSIRSREGRG